MCRLLGVVSSEHTDFRLTLREAPRSLALLSREHPHGWGVAVWADANGWTIAKEAECAQEDSRFHAVAHGSRGELLLAHVRNRTVGEKTLANTHPFRRGRWLFAHNGTITERGRLRALTSPTRLGEVHGETDSELLFAALLSRLDAAGVTDHPAGAATDGAIAGVMRHLLDGPFGAANFLLSDGMTLYAHRHGRTLYLLERRPGDQVIVRRHSAETGATLETPWTWRCDALLVASEHITDEPWSEIEERALLRIDRLPLPAWRRITDS
jgi:predicted glutamine amidotransferase